MRSDDMKHLLEHLLLADIFGVSTCLTLGQFRLDDAMKRRCVVLVLISGTLVMNTNAQWIQQGAKLVALLSLIFPLRITVKN
jgi:hypothetical protein